LISERYVILWPTLFDHLATRDDMSKTIFGWTLTGVFAAAIVSFGSGPSAAFSPSSALSNPALDGAVTLIAQQQQRRGKSKGKQSKPKISPEHQQQIRQNVPQEYHQYIPGLTPGR
jgi:hypothetical protein